MIIDIDVAKRCSLAINGLREEEHRLQNAADAVIAEENRLDGEAATDKTAAETGEASSEEQK